MIDVSASYAKLVRQVYIDPIRSVVVVDDDFPTLDGLLATVKTEVVESVATADERKATHNDSNNSQSDDSLTPKTPQETIKASATPATHSPYVDLRFAGKWHEVERARKLIEACRKRDRPWLVDIHDGRPESGTDELAIAPFLHHSDLMILDYHLEGDSGSGDRAIKILQTLASNDQFNLVIVYTKGVDGDIQKVFEQIATSLTYRDRFPLGEAKMRAIELLVAEWEEEADNYHISDDIKRRISTLTYLTNRGEQDSIKREIGEAFKDLAEQCPREIKNMEQTYHDGPQPKTVRLHAGTLLEMALATRHSEHYDAMSEQDLGLVHCAFGTNSNWIRTDRLFITVVNKGNPPDVLVEKLESALNAWGPGPHQLLMGKMRAQLGEKGGIAEGDILRDRHLQAGWLREMLDNDGDGDRVMHHSINRHWEALGDRMHSDVKKFAEELFSNFKAADRADIENRYIPRDVTKIDELAHLNHYYSTKPVDRTHLTTGQVLKLKSDKDDQPFEYWICLSPACDLVPGQKKRGWKQRLGQSMPFIAAQLIETSLNTALKQINENRFVFLRTTAGISAFTFVADSKSTSMPIWEQMFAAKNGKFVDGKCAIEIMRAREVEGVLTFKTSEVDVVCQLRYEYALNLLQRLGGSMSRIGLDFRSLPDED